MSDTRTLPHLYTKEQVNKNRMSRIVRAVQLSLRIYTQFCLNITAESNISFIIVPVIFIYFQQHKSHIQNNMDDHLKIKFLAFSKTDIYKKKFKITKTEYTCKHIG